MNEWLVIALIATLILIPLLILAFICFSYDQRAALRNHFLRQLELEHFGFPVPPRLLVGDPAFVAKQKAWAAAEFARLLRGAEVDHD